MSLQQTREQERARAAWDDVASAQGKREEYLALARGAAVDVQVNGLGQTLAFWKARGDKPHYKSLYDQLSRWVGGQMGASGDLLEWLIAPSTGSDSYRRATLEAIAYLVWVKRFAEAKDKDERQDRQLKAAEKEG